MFCEVQVRSVGYEICYRVHRSPQPGIPTEVCLIPGYGHEVRTDLTEPSGKGMKVFENSQNYRAQSRLGIELPR